jgi:hypothetical protein
VITRTAALLLTSPAGLVWAWPEADDGRLNVMILAGPTTSEPVQSARELAASGFGLDSYHPRLRLLAQEPEDRPHPAGWTHLYAWTGEEPDTDSIVSTGWWDDPRALLGHPAAVADPALATLRAAYRDAP